MGHGKLRKVSTISKNISTTTNFQTTSSPVSASNPDDDPSTAELKRRRSSARRSIYSIADEFIPEADDTGKPKPPDGGYGWVIVLAIHFTQAMGVGFLTSLGIFYIEWRKYFGSTAAETGLVVSLSSVVMGLISPMAVGVAVIIGARPLVMTGAIIVFIGLLATSFANSILQLTFTVGVVTAFGYGMICSPAIMPISDYFDVNYGLATGIAFSGTSLGQLIFPPLSVEFIYWFGGWKGAMFIFSALLLNLAAFGALMRPLKKPKHKKKRPACILTAYKNDTPASDPTIYENATPVSTLTAYEKTTSANILTTYENATYASTPTTYENATSTSDPTTYENATSTSDPTTYENATYASTLKAYEKSTSASILTTYENASYASIQTTYENATPASDPTTYENAAFQEDLNHLEDFPSTSYDTGLHAKEITQLDKELPILNVIVCDDWVVPYIDSHPKQLHSSANPKNMNLKKYKKKIRAIMKNFIHFLAKSYGIPGVFQSPLFVMMIPAIICQGIGWYATITHQAARAMSVGISEEDASFLLSLMGIGSLVGRVSHGWFIDRGFITSEMCLVFSLGVCSVSTYMMCFANLFPILAVLATIQGMTAGIANTLAVVVIKTFAKPNFEDSAVGMLFLIWGFGDLIGGVVAGYLYDSTGDYNVSFYFAGSAFAFCTILVYLTCVLKNRIVDKLFQNLKLQRLENDDESTDRLDEMDTNAKEGYVNQLNVITEGYDVMTEGYDVTTEGYDVISEGYDNEVFKMEAEDDVFDDIVEQSEVNVVSVFNIEIHNTGERSNIMQANDTNV